MVLLGGHQEEGPQDKLYFGTLAVDRALLEHPEEDH